MKRALLNADAVLKRDDAFIADEERAEYLDDLTHGRVVVQRAKARIGRWLNAMTGAASLGLPSETVDEIFLIVALSSPPVVGSQDPTDMGWISLPLVCCDWKARVYANKRFWASVHGYNPITIPRSFAFSGNLPLSYRHTEVHPNAPRSLDSDLLAAAIDVFEPRRYYCITVDRGDAAMAHLKKVITCSQEEPLGDLKEIVLRWDQDFGTGGDFDFARNLCRVKKNNQLLAPALTSATFSGFSPFIVGSAVRVLNIDLFNCRPSTRPPLGTVLKMLSVLSPALEELRLIEVIADFGTSGFTVTEALIPVTLPRLSVFNFENKMTITLKAINFINIPSSTRRRIGMTLDDDQPTNKQFTGLMRYTVRESSTSNITVSINTLNIAGMLVNVKVKDVSIDNSTQEHVIAHTYWYGEYRPRPTCMRLARLCIQSLPESVHNVRVEVPSVYLEGGDGAGDVVGSRNIIRKQLHSDEIQRISLIIVGVPSL